MILSCIYDHFIWADMFENIIDYVKKTFAYIYPIFYHLTLHCPISISTVECFVGIRQ